MPTARTRSSVAGTAKRFVCPKDVAFVEDVEQVIFRSALVKTIYPAGMSIREMAARLRALPAPPSVEVRDVEDLERDGP